MVIQIVGKQSNTSRKMMVEFGHNFNCGGIILMLSNLLKTYFILQLEPTINVKHILS